MTLEAPTNLTLLADKHRPYEPRIHRIEVFSHPRLTAEIVIGQHQAASQSVDEVYVIVTGYGVLQSLDAPEIEVTEGDVIFVPAGSTAHFGRVSTGFKTWRITTGGRPTPEM